MRAPLLVLLPALAACAEAPPTLHAEAALFRPGGGGPAGPGAYDLSEANVTVNGVAAGGAFGRGMLGPGDLTGDGRDDLVVSAPDGPSGGTAVGTAWVLAGPLGPRASLRGAAALITLGGIAEGLGETMDAGDGGLWLGAPRAARTAEDQGAAWLYAAPLTGRLRAADAEASIQGAAGDNLAWALDVADLDGDGTDDLVLGAPGQGDGGAALVYYGPHSGRLVPAAADLRVEGASADALAGTRLLVDADLTGDGQADLVVGEPGPDSSAGRVLVFAEAGEGTLDTDDADAALSGEDPSDEAGGGLCAPGDVDGDGHRDLWVGADEHSATASEDGVVYLVPGPIEADIDLADSAVRITGTAANDHAGWLLECGADVDGDGANDLLVAVPADDHAGGSNAGTVALFVSPYAGTAALDDGDVVLRGESTGAAIGNGAALVGDLNGDGLPDIGVDGPGSTGAGAAHLYTTLATGF